ncbi:MAG: FAD:protein FMN transferase [Planctomycetes bacterium]|nr:FAD:protein FMN transferase [Planctomycetota bacterium]
MIPPAGPALRHPAMATVFEIHLPSEDPRRAEQAAEAAFELLDRIERELSRHIEASDISRLNHRAGGEPLRIRRDAFACLEAGLRLREETGGAFDVTFASWRLPGRRIELDRAARTARLAPAGARIDLGGIGKGFAVDRMADLLRDWGFERGLISGGKSTILAFGKGAGWPLALDVPGRGTIVRGRFEGCAVGASTNADRPHIIDPRDGRAIPAGRAAWAFAPTATDADALSTAVLVMDAEAIEECCARRAGISAVIAEGGRATRIRTTPGVEIEESS